MSYPLLRKGDRLPAVGVLQKLLNLNGAGLTVSGRFDAATRTAVTQFQEANRIYSANGSVSRETWTRLMSGGHATLQLPVIDCVDVWDMSLYEYEAADIAASGGSPILIGGMCNGVEQAVDEILRRAGSNVFLLRFHGHGAPGFAGVSVGHGAFSRGERASIDVSNMEALMPVLSRLRSIFGRYGCVQFMHCATGASIRGQQLLEFIADTLEVPATGAQLEQLGGGMDTFAYEGPTTTAIPGGASLEAWAGSLPNFPDMYRVRPIAPADPHAMMH
ncbi:peptidoglycan-binding domain-containing protein [Taibaiella helva]|uniref:peptidoglycan-binding domain-containing protein n=1 Tax=Taibaiella helva TaxID=2301235 RepID=UPI000E593F94|nr:peptidoglycan-binding domain-containing protein [Taibaiella helva]